MVCDVDQVRARMTFPQEPEQRGIPHNECTDSFTGLMTFPQEAEQRGVLRNMTFPQVPEQQGILQNGCTDSFTGLVIPFQLLSSYLPIETSFIVTPTTSLSDPSRTFSAANYYAQLGVSIGIVGRSTDALELIRQGNYAVGGAIYSADTQVSSLFHMGSQLVCNYQPGIADNLAACFNCFRETWPSPPMEVNLTAPEQRCVHVLVHHAPSAVPMSLSSMLLALSMSLSSMLLALSMSLSSMLLALFHVPLSSMLRALWSMSFVLPCSCAVPCLVLHVS
eukprot:gene3792-13861_t